MLIISAISRGILPFSRTIFGNKCRFKTVQNIGSENVKCYCSRTNILDVNTNVAKDVILYKSENAKFFKYVNLFGITQLGFWLYLGEWSFSSMRDAPVDNSVPVDAPWYKKINLGENKYKNSIAGFCVLFGYLMLSGAWMFTLRSVRYLILRKGGDSVSIVTYGPFGRNRILTVPLKCVSAAESRQTAKASLPIKVHRKWLYYLVDMKGEFRNTTLFDATIGIRRRFL